MTADEYRRRALKRIDERLRGILRGWERLSAGDAEVYRRCVEKAYERLKTEEERTGSP